MTTQTTNVTNVQVIKGLIIASLAAVVLTVTVVLPAEYKQDPTGIGAILGLTSLKTESRAETMTSAPQPEFSFARSEGLWRTETLTVEIPDYEGVEIKALVEAGNGFSFSWQTTSGDLYMDMHGERSDNAAQFVSYEKSHAIASDSGIFKAPFTGTHGWYWQNNSDKPVTVKLVIAGFYQSVNTIKE